MKNVHALLAVALVGTLAGCSPNNTKITPEPVAGASVQPAPMPTILVIDGKVMAMDEVKKKNAIDPNMIERIDVRKNEPALVVAYGPDAVNGVIFVTLKKTAVAKKESGK
nr:hypothetical protein [uncultured Arsenicibacter sp.]